MVLGKDIRFFCVTDKNTPPAMQGEGKSLDKRNSCVSIKVGLQTTKNTTQEVPKMDTTNSLAHTKWECKLVIPTCCPSVSHRLHCRRIPAI